MEQRLVSVYISTDSEPHRDLCEHLSDYLDDGWRVVEFKTLAGSSGATATIAGWIVVLVERGK